MAVKSSRRTRKNSTGVAYEVGYKGPNRRRQTALLIAQRRRRVLTLYLTGLDGKTFCMEEIADELSVSVSTIHADIKAVEKSWRDENLAARDEYVKCELTKLALLEYHAVESLSVATTLEDKDGATVVLSAADPAAYQRSMISIFKRRSALLGLDAPIRHELTGEAGAPLDMRVRGMSDADLEHVAAGREKNSRTTTTEKKTKKKTKRSK